MSYPQVVQALVIEDEQDAKENYEAAFETLIKQGIAVQPKYAFCYEDAVQQLQGSTIFHLVFLDLRLPNTPGMPPSADLNLGLAVLQQCEERDRYPIPALIIRSGCLGDANQSELRARVEGSFCYGAVFVKGGGLETELETAIERIRAYCGVGIHLRDAGERQYPGLSPRDEDLLRRCILFGGHIGVDLEWWSANYARSTVASERFAGWTNTLMGRFILGEGMDLSLPTFFKFAPAAEAPALHRGTHILGQKLSHVKQVGFHTAGGRCLLATQKVGDGEEPPTSLEEYLGRDPEEVARNTSSIAADLVRQIGRLGANSPNKARLANILWANHEHVAGQWERWADTETRANPGGAGGPVSVLQELQANQDAIRYSHQTCLHGDLNITNVALDVLPDVVHAYIFDAGGCCDGVMCRDLAMLEVTALLHQKSVYESLVRHCACLYGDGILPPQDLDLGTGSDPARNTLRFIAELRSQVLSTLDDPRLYALMVFDNALMQLGGLYYQVSSNKIRDPRDAARLAALTAGWLRRVAPEFVGGGAGSASGVYATR